MEIPEELLLCVLGVLAVFLSAHGLPRIHAALRRPEGADAALLLVRGARSFIAAAALTSIGIGHSVGSDGLVWFGVAFLAEEIYETGVVLGILRWGKTRGWV